MTDPRTAERIARNDALFRHANEGIGETAAEYEIGGLVPFLCECADVNCTAFVQVSISEYEGVRASPTHFVNLPGHQVAAGDTIRVVDENDRYIVVEKIGVAGRVAADLDPRSSEDEVASA